MTRDLFKEFIQSFKESEKERTEKTNRLKLLLSEKVSLIEEERKLAKTQEADIIMYTNEFSMSIVDPTYIYDKVIGGIKKLSFPTRCQRIDTD